MYGNSFNGRGVLKDDDGQRADRVEAVAAMDGNIAMEQVVTIL